MRAIRKILVPLKELNGRAPTAVLKAAQLARAHGASLELFHVLTSGIIATPPSGSPEFLTSLENDTRQAALRRLEAFADRLRTHSIKVTVSAQWDYPEYEAIIRRARTVRADLIVASQHAGRHRLPWLMRLTDWELLRSCPMPLLLVKNPRLYRHPAILAAIDPTHAHNKPYALDRDILATAGKWTALLRGKLHAVHSYSRFPANAPPEMLTPGMLDKLARDSERFARRRFARALKSWRIANKRRHLIAGPPVDAIAVAANENRCAIVVMGAISRSGFKRMLIGNTAEHVLDALACDVLIVKPRRFQSRVPRKIQGAVQSLAFSYPYPLSPL